VIEDAVDVELQHIRLAGLSGFPNLRDNLTGMELEAAATLGNGPGGE
jgi:hypothetical protein